MVGRGPFGLKAGQWTDDTAMAICLAESLIECRSFDARDQMQRYIRWWREGVHSPTGRCFDIGNATSASLARFEKDGEPFAGSDDPYSAGNGSIMYAVYHGPDGLKRIAKRVHGWAVILAEALSEAGEEVLSDRFFDTLRVRPTTHSVNDVLAAAAEIGVNLREFGDGTLGIALDEKTDGEEIAALIECFGGRVSEITADSLEQGTEASARSVLARTSAFLDHPVFNSYQSETEMLRYIYRLQQRDLSLATSMIPLGSCTMKLNATTEMLPVTWPHFGALHPFCPDDQAGGYMVVGHLSRRWAFSICRMHIVPRAFLGLSR